MKLQIEYVIEVEDLAKVKQAAGLCDRTYRPGRDDDGVLAATILLDIWGAGAITVAAMGMAVSEYGVVESAA